LLIPPSHSANLCVVSSAAVAFPRLSTERLLLVVPEPSDAPRLLAYNTRNRGHLRPFSPPEPAGTSELGFWHLHVQRLHQEVAAGSSLPFRLTLRDDPAGPFVGAANLTQICRGPFAACYLGYHLDSAHVGLGLMTEALRAVIAHAFDGLALHRIMANYVPSNVRSAKVLAKLGFVIEGYAREYLFIDGRWQDHVLSSLTNRKLGEPVHSLG
jgi:ribosomal-protein-alanine N-acetyltransferase